MWDGFWDIAIGKVLAYAEIATDHPVLLGPNECQTRSSLQLLVSFFVLHYLFFIQCGAGCQKEHSLAHWCTFGLLLKLSS